MTPGTFATAINCMDGRFQLPIITWMQKEYGSVFVDMITAAGPNKILSENSDFRKVEAMKDRVKISVEKHESKVVAIVGHEDCAGNPADKKTQLKDIKKAVKLIKTWDFDVDVVGLWVDLDFKVEKIR